MKPISTTIGDCIEAAYAAEFDNLTTAQDSAVFKADMLGLMYHYVGFQIDLDRNNRFLRIMAMCLACNFSLQEKDDFYNTYNVSQTVISAFDQYIPEGWPLPVETVLPNNTVDVSQLRNRLISKVNFDAGKIRSKFITVAPGKDMVYIGKWMESRDYFEDSDPDPNDYPLLSIEIGKTYNGQTITTLEEAATLIQTMYAQWKEWAKLIEEASSTAIATLKNTEVVDVNELLAAADINWQQVIPALFPALPAPEPEPEPEPEGE